MNENKFHHRDTEDTEESNHHNDTKRTKTEFQLDSCPAEVFYLRVLCVSVVKLL